jgi:hypothetical protein
MQSPCLLFLVTVPIHLIRKTKFCLVTILIHPISKTQISHPGKKILLAIDHRHYTEIPHFWKRNSKKQTMRWQLLKLGLHLIKRTNKSTTSDTRIQCTGRIPLGGGLNLKLQRHGRSHIVLCIFEYEVVGIAPCS